MASVSLLPQSRLRLRPLPLPLPPCFGGRVLPLRSLTLPAPRIGTGLPSISTATPLSKDKMPPPPRIIIALPSDGLAWSTDEMRAFKSALTDPPDFYSISDIVGSRSPLDCQVFYERNVRAYPSSRVLIKIEPPGLGTRLMKFIEETVTSIMIILFAKRFNAKSVVQYFRKLFKWTEE